MVFGVSFINHKKTIKYLSKIVDLNEKSKNIFIKNKIII